MADQNMAMTKHGVLRLISHIFINKIICSNDTAQKLLFNFYQCRAGHRDAGEPVLSVPPLH